MGEIERYQTNLLPQASFFKGLGSVLNVSGNYYKFDYSKNGAEADKKAIESDWNIVGQDIKLAMKKATKVSI